METRDLSQIVDAILWGKSLIESSGDFTPPTTFILRSLTIKEVNYSDFIYRREFELSRRSGLYTHDEISSVWLSQGIWTPEHDVKLATLEKSIQKFIRQIHDAQHLRVRRRQLEARKQFAEEERDELLSTKQTLFANTAESRAEEIRRRFIVMMSTEDRFERPYWPTEQDFLAENDHTLIYNLAIAYYKNNIFDEKTLRKVARSGLWRYRWKVARQGADLFGKPIANWSEMQNLIVYWSQYYDYVMESPDSPPTHIIDDDVACDKWVEDQNKKYSRNRSERSNSSLPTKRKRPTKYEHQEEFLFVSPGDKDAIEDVQSLNSETVRHRLRAEHKRIKEKGRISEFKLRRGRLPNGEYYHAKK